MGNYPSGSFSSPGLKPRKTEFYYTKTPHYNEQHNLDKIIASETGSQIVEPDLRREKEKVHDTLLETQENRPELDLEKAGGSKRKLNTLFKVDY